MSRRVSRRSRLVATLRARLGAVAASALLTGWLAPAQGADSNRCDLVVQGAGAERWEGAVAALERRARAQSMQIACRRLALQVHPRGATLLFHVSDGRLAVRALAGPQELWPTVVALSVALPTAGAAPRPVAIVTPMGNGWAPAPLPTPQPAPAEPSLSALSPATDDGGERARARRELLLSEAVRFGLDAGARSGAGGLISARMGALAALALARAELGVGVAYEPGYSRPGDSSVRGARHGMAVGAFAGRRAPLGGQVALVGGRAELAVLQSTARSSRAEARVGAYAGLLLEDLLSVPLRTTIAFDVLPTELGRAPASAEDGRSPWWAVSVGVGVELGGA
jgi:hypothetical protein